MLKNSMNCDVRQCRVYRLLFLLFLTVFAIAPLADAYTDSLCPSPVFFDDLIDSDLPVSINDLKLNDALNSLHALKSASERKLDDHALLVEALAIDGTACHIIRRDVQLCALKIFQACPPLSSDPSPPVA
ncbi:MAG: hypothetical protein M0R70_10515 [Nitrospirae bacterium]|nr:hypothetical protein [Nitrospirota bacterium]